MTTPLVTVVVGAYNCSAFLPGLFDCLDRQTYREFTVVVVDDASTDGETLRRLEAAGDRIRLIRRDVNSRTCERPRYQGVMVADTPLVAFLDADDRWDPGFLSRCVDYMNEHPEAALVHTYVRVIDDDGKVSRIRHENVMPTGPRVARALLNHCFITISSVVARRAVWLEALPVDAICDFGMDQDFFLAIARKYPIGFIPEVLASYRRSAASVSVKNWKRAPRNVNTLERIRRRGLWRGVVARRDMRTILVEAYHENAEHWRHQNRPWRAAWFCASGLARHGWHCALVSGLGKALWSGLVR